MSHFVANQQGQKTVPGPTTRPPLLEKPADDPGIVYLLSIA